ncbi:putative quinol monooxygenase [Humibacter antri]
MGEVHLAGQLLCADDKEVAIVVANLPEHIALTRAERGCLSFEVIATSDRRVFDVEERFEDEQAFGLHHERAANSEWGQLTARMERRYSVQIASR